MNNLSGPRRYCFFIIWPTFKRVWRPLLCNIIINNDNFNQTICNAIATEYDKKVQQLQVELNKSNTELKSLKNEIDDLSQYSRCSCLVIHGIPYSLSENTDEVVKKFLKEHIQIEINDADIDRFHCLCSINEKQPLVVKFTRYNLKSKIYVNKKKPAGKPFLIFKLLTSKMD